MRDGRPVGCREDSLVFNFTIDGSGNVLVDAETLPPDLSVQRTANGWDIQSAGTVTDASLFNTAFLLTASGGGDRIRLGGENGGGIGVSGGNGNSGRIDVAEKLAGSLTSGNVVVKIKRFDYANGAKGARTDVEIVSGDYSNAWYDLSPFGTQDLDPDGAIVASGRDLVFEAASPASSG